MTGSVMRLLVVLTILARAAVAQDAPLPKLSGTTWQRIQLTNDSGVAQAGAAPSYLMFSNDGYYIQVGFRDDRPRLTREFADLTKNQLLAQLRGSEARVGRYSLVGSRLSRTYLTSLNGQSEQTPAQIQDVHVSGDTLFLQTVGTRGESRWRKAK